MATEHGLSADTCNSTLNEILKVQDADASELYEAKDWLQERQAEIEQRIAAKHLCEGSLIFTMLPTPMRKEPPVPWLKMAIRGTKRKGNYKSFSHRQGETVDCSGLSSLKLYRKSRNKDII